jgi:hypothetical protein
MKNGRINAWVAIVGFATLAVGLALEGVAIYETSTDTGLGRPSSSGPSR